MIWIGNLLSQERDYIFISISKWTGLPTCKTDAEIEGVLNSMTIAFAITDYFFDTDDYSSPLKVNFRNDIIFTPVSGLSKSIDVCCLIIIPSFPVVGVLFSKIWKSIFQKLYPIHSQKLANNLFWSILPNFSFIKLITYKD